jgi:ligand-binding SRPBCC domain-containing protein
MPNNLTGRFHLESQISLGQPRQEVFSFLADALNLEKLTPSWLHFKILTPMPIPIEKGTLIDYRLRIWGIPIRWRTEIILWEPPFRFVDTQVHGPYRVWIHEHKFLETEDGTSMIDSVHYDVWGGRFIDRLVVRSDIEKVFAYRQKKIIELFGSG